MRTGLIDIVTRACIRTAYSWCAASDTKKIIGSHYFVIGMVSGLFPFLPPPRVANFVERAANPSDPTVNASDGNLGLRIVLQ